MIMIDIFIIIFSVVLEDLIGFLQKNNKFLHVLFSLLTMIIVYVLLFVLGAELGRNKYI